MPQDSLAEMVLIIPVELFLWGCLSCVSLLMGSSQDQRAGASAFSFQAFTHALPLLFLLWAGLSELSNSEYLLGGGATGVSLIHGYGVWRSLQQRARLLH